jgi:hypothetical protein
MAQAEIGDDSIETKSVDLGHHDVAQPVPTTRNASNPAPVTQDFGISYQRPETVTH